MNSAVSLSGSSSPDTGGPYRVMVVDDSAVIRGFMSRYLTEDPQISVEVTANNGAVALNRLKNHDIEVVVLDIEMPEMDGLTALPKMIEMQPGLMVVMASTLTRKNADISMRSLNMGAVDYVPKPETARSVNASIDFRRELVEKVKVWAARGRRKRNEKLPSAPVSAESSPASATGRLSSGFVSARRAERPLAALEQSRARGSRALSGSQEGDKTIRLKPDPRKKADILAIGSSTGGPQALMRFFKQFDAPPKVPVVIVQHMPATFTAILADHLAQATGWKSQEGEQGMAVKPGEIYIAPGGKHMELTGDRTAPVINLTEDPPENFCRPAVDPLYRSLLSLYGDRVLAVILTGMGHDGLKGARMLTQAGATLLAQDEASSVVWGMPGAVATAGLCSEVLPLDDLGRRVFERLKGGR